MIDQRDPAWYLVHDRGGEISDLEVRLDVLDAQVYDEQLLKYEQTKTRLERIGIDTSKYRPPPRRSRTEQPCSRHPWNDLEAVIATANESVLDRLAREHLADTEPVPEPAPLLCRYFKTEIHIR